MSVVPREISTDSRSSPVSLPSLSPTRSSPPPRTHTPCLCFGASDASESKEATPGSSEPLAPCSAYQPATSSCRSLRYHDSNAAILRRSCLAFSPSCFRLVHELESKSPSKERSPGASLCNDAFRVSERDSKQIEKASLFYVAQHGGVVLWQA